MTILIAAIGVVVFIVTNMIMFVVANDVLILFVVAIGAVVVFVLIV